MEIFGKGEGCMVNGGRMITREGCGFRRVWL